MQVIANSNTQIHDIIVSKFNTSRSSKCRLRDPDGTLKVCLFYVCLKLELSAFQM